MAISIQIGEVCGARMIARARRFPIHAIMHYHSIGEGTWYMGTVENMSSTGVLFCGEHFVALDSLIEVAVDIPGMLAGGSSSKVVSLGKIIRVSPCISDPKCTMIAAALDRPRILRTDPKIG